MCWSNDESCRDYEDDKCNRDDDDDGGDDDDDGGGGDDDDDDETKVRKLPPPFKTVQLAGRSGPARAIDRNASPLQQAAAGEAQTRTGRTAP